MQNRVVIIYANSFFPVEVDLNKKKFRLIDDSWQWIMFGWAMKLFWKFARIDDFSFSSVYIPPNIPIKDSDEVEIILYKKFK